MFATSPALAPTDREALRMTFVIGLFFMVGTMLVQATALEPHPGVWRDGSTLVVGRDFMNFWMYGRAAMGDDPGRWYDLAAYHEAQRAMLGADYPGQNWSYPPTVMPFAVPFATMPYLAALMLWSALGVAIFAATLTRLGASSKLVVTLLASPAAVLCLMSGQSSLITAAMIFGAFSLLDRRPLLAGVLIGLLTMKPQLGLLFPVMLIASGRWRAFGAAAATALILAAATTALYGVEIWRDFVTMGLPVQGEVLADPELVATPFYVTVFMNVRGLDAPYAVAMAAQLVFTFGALALTWMAFRKRSDADPALLMALFLAASVAATPYMLSYDTLPLAACAMALRASGKLEGHGRLLATLVFWLPLLQITLGALHIPGPALVAPAFGLWVAGRLGVLPLPSRMATQPG